MSTSNLIRPGGRSRPGRLVALLTVTAVAASLLSAPSSPAPAAASLAPAADPGVAAGLLPAGAEPVAVTLITGDTVLWQDAGDGSPRLEIEQAPRDYPVTFDRSGTQEDFYVIPSDVMEQVVAGTVDEELFNIPGLIRQGLDDATTDELPVIVTFDQDRSVQQLARDADALPATSDATALEKVNGAGVRVDRGKAGTFRQAVFGEPGRGSSNRATSTEGLDGAVEQVLLDRVLHIDLADSVPQIGAPHAWDAGYTGEGVTVAVLDTGIDPSHPDLAGQVVAAANFTNEPDATDTHGHGTHVASTIAGTGAASGGTRKGVAPGADLLNGKVCFRNAAGQGVCPTSSIMAGMEWATQQGADIVNMSLGGSPTDGTDPLSQLVNELAAETDTLFVISAGNFGGIRTVGSPAAADAALAVGAVDKSDRLAGFSSLGPRVGDHAVKPEITAPGVGIVAARADGTGIGVPVNGDYTTLNGTSMASPHVAGAAALLAQVRPELGWSELKNVLVSTAADGGLLWLQQGTGRIDVPAALNSPVYAQATVNFGGIDGQSRQELTYSNHSDTDLTLHLNASITDINGQDADAASVTLSTDSVTVPATGHASVTVSATLDASGLPGNTAFGGVVTAIGDGVKLRTGIGFGPPLQMLTVEVLDFNGDRVGSDTAPDGFVSLTHDTLDREVGGPPVYQLGTNDGIATGHIPPGTYTIITTVVEKEPDAAVSEFTRGALLVEVEIEIDTNTTLILDARDAVPIEQPDVPHEADRRNHQVAVIRTLPGSGGAGFTRTEGGAKPIYVTPAPPGELAPVGLWVHWTLAEPLPVQPLPWNGGELCPQLPFFCYSQTPAYVYNLPFLYENGIPSELHEEVTQRELVELPTRYHSDHPDALISHKFEALVPFSVSVGAGDAVRMWFRPGRVREYMLADDRVTWLRVARLERRPESGGAFALNMFSDDRFPAAEAGSRRSEERWFDAPLRMGAKDSRDEVLGNQVGLEREATTSRGGPDGNLFVPGIHVMDNARGHGGRAPAFGTWRMWNLDAGVELAGGPVFTLAPQPATYRLEQTEEYPDDVAGLFRTGRATTTWTFTSSPSEAHVPHGYQCVLSPADICQIQPLIQLEYDLGLDIHNSISARKGAHVLRVTAGHHSKAIHHAPVMSMSVQVSFDDGDTWQDARVVGKPKDTWDTGGFLPSSQPRQEFRVIFRIPPLHRTNEFVTLRVRATDANGGTIQQTIRRAYILR